MKASRPSSNSTTIALVVAALGLVAASVTASAGDAKGLVEPCCKPVKAAKAQPASDTKARTRNARTTKVTGSNLEYRTAADGRIKNSHLNVMVIQKDWMDQQGRSSLSETLSQNPGAFRGR